MILLGKAFYYRYESLDFPLEGGGTQFISLSVVGGCHRVSKYYATLCLGSDCMAYKHVPTDSAN